MLAFKYGSVATFANLFYNFVKLAGICCFDIASIGYQVQNFFDRTQTVYLFFRLV